MSHSQIILEKYRLKQRRASWLHNLRFLVTMRLVRGTCSEKVTGCVCVCGGGAWPGPLASMESWSCSHFPARLSSKVYHKRTLWTFWGPYPQAMKGLPCSPSGHMPYSKWSTGSCHLLGLFAEVLVPNLCSSFPVPASWLVLIWPTVFLIKLKAPRPGLNDPAATQTLLRAGTQK